VPSRGQYDKTKAKFRQTEMLKNVGQTPCYAEKSQGIYSYAQQQQCIVYLKGYFKSST